jgi:hypothetical protein
MKRCKNVTCWTDYPFSLLGDASGKKAPIRRVAVLSYDGNKYALVQCLKTGVTQDLKAGYLYRHAGRLERVKAVNRRKLERMITQEQKP